MVEEALYQLSIKIRAGLRMIDVMDQVVQGLRHFHATGDFLHQLLFLCRQRISLSSKVVALLGEERRFQIAPRHDGGQRLPLLHDLLQLLVDLVDPEQVAFVRLSPDRFDQCVENFLLSEDQLVHHGRESIFQVNFPDVLQGAGADIIQMLLADPNRIPDAAGGVDVPFKAAAAFTADELAGKGVPVLVAGIILLDILFLRPLLQKGSGSPSGKDSHRRTSHS